jgi:hypothetical protein
MRKIRTGAKTGADTSIKERGNQEARREYGKLD